MKLIRRRLLDLAALLTIFGPCRTAFAEDAVANAGPAGSAATPAAEREPKRDVGSVDEKKEESKRTDHFRIGVLGGTGFPRPLALEGMVKIERAVGLGVEYSVLPRLTISGVETSFWALAADVRIFPFRDAFFVGLRAGRQHLGGEGTVTVANYGSVHETVAVDTTFINPRIGLLWTWESGVTLGVDVGVQIPLSATSSNSIPTNLPVGTELGGQITSTANSLGKYTLPTIDLLKIGVLL